MCKTAYRYHCPGKQAILNVEPYSPLPSPDYLHHVTELPTDRPHAHNITQRLTFRNPLCKQFAATILPLALCVFFTLCSRTPADNGETSPLSAKARATHWVRLRAKTACVISEKHYCLVCAINVSNIGFTLKFQFLYSDNFFLYVFLWDTL